MKSHIIINSNLKQRIVKLSNLTQSYSDVIEKLVSHAEVCDQFWNEKK